MNDDLRERIAAVICGMDALHAQQWSLDVADAVIEELGLAECNDHDCRCTHPYVTEWKTDE